MLFSAPNAYVPSGCALLLHRVVLLGKEGRGGGGGPKTVTKRVAEGQREKHRSTPVGDAARQHQRCKKCQCRFQKAIYIS